MTATPTPAADTFRRIGPRPLGLHLATAALSWTGAVLPGGAWLAHQRKSDPVAETMALVRAAERRFARLLAGIDAYQKHPYRRSMAEPPAVWRGNGVRLLDFGGAAGPDGADGMPLLVIPSLINRYHILDLHPDHSFIRYLQSQGFRPFVVAWDDFGRAARHTTVDDCVAGKLEAALGIVRLHTRRPPVLIGYCLGGTLAAALAARRPGDITGLVTLAAPWDFHADGGGIGPAATFAAEALKPVLDAAGALPVDLVQTLFYTLDPFQVIDKFLRFAAAAPDAAAGADFVAVEDWLNDGFPLPAPITRTLLADWYGANAPANGQWKIEGRLVDLTQVGAPALVVTPARDRIVPPASARAMADSLPAPEVLEVPRGHVGMIASRRARDQVWSPMVEWLHRAAETSVG